MVHGRLLAVQVRRRRDTFGGLSQCSSDAAEVSRLASGVSQCLSCSRWIERVCFGVHGFRSSSYAGSRTAQPRKYFARCMGFLNLPVPNTGVMHGSKTRKHVVLVANW